MLARLKLPLYEAAKRLGGFSAVLNSAWRRKRLAILCYHGISLDDEHVWNPGLYITPDRFRQRLETLRRLRCNILPLSEGVERLREGSLPPRSVVITFDDGFHDFYRHAAPLLKQFQAPATVYVSSYYCFFPRPIFTVTVSYLLWKAAGKTLTWPDLFGPGPVTREKIFAYAAEKRYSAQDKDRMLSELAERVGIDFEELSTRRILQLMNPEELRAIAADGIDIQLHTHRHTMPRDREGFLKELQDNREALAPFVRVPLQHFCYPSGVYYPESEAALREAGILSATTCDPGLASARSNLQYLPRYLDAMNIPDLVFEAWVTGASMVLPHRVPKYGGDL